jgi:hypothetical protein
MNESKRRIVASLIILIVAALLISNGCAAANQTPIISALTASEEWVEAGSTCQVECTASDPDGDELSYSWSTDSGHISGEGSAVSWTAPEVPGNYIITVAITDGRGSEATRQLSVNVAAVNHPPIIESLIVTAEHGYLEVISVEFSTEKSGYKILEGTDYKIECVASDPDGDELFFEWSADEGTISGDNALITWTAPLGKGERNVTITVSDGMGGTATESIVFAAVTCGSCAFPPEDTPQ